jgi:peroxin-16
VASEALYSSLSLLGLYHDRILAKAVDKLNDADKPTPSAHNKYTRYWLQKSPIYARLANFVQLLQATSFLAEIIARKRFGERGRWRCILLIETAKVFCRILLLQETSGRMLVFPHVPTREMDPANIEASLDLQAFEEAKRAGEHPDPKQLERSTPEKLLEPVLAAASAEPTLHSLSLTKTKQPVSQFQSQEAVTAYLLTKTLYPRDLLPPPALLTQLSPAGKIAEILYILRPLVYALLLYRSKDRKRSWRPWLVSLGIEYAARELHKQARAGTYSGSNASSVSSRLRGFGHVYKGVVGQTGGGNTRTTQLESEERTRRAWSLGWYLVRGAFYHNMVKPRVDGFTDRALAADGSGRGFMGVKSLVAGVVRDYDYFFNSYFTTSSI